MGDCGLGCAHSWCLACGRPWCAVEGRIVWYSEHRGAQAVCGDCWESVGDEELIRLHREALDQWWPPEEADRVWPAIVRAIVRDRREELGVPLG